MSRSRERKSCRYHTRWSEPILRGRYSATRNPIVTISDEESCSSSVKRSGSSSTFINKLQLTTTPRGSDDERKGCCRCCGSRRKRYGKLINEKRYSRIDYSKSCDDNYRSTRRFRDSLKIELAGDRIGESVACEKLTALIKRLEIATEIVEAIVEHVDSLDISNSSLQRVLRLANDLLNEQRSASSIIVAQNSYNKELSADDLTIKIRQAESSEEKRIRSLRCAVDSCSKNLSLSKRLNNLIEEDRVKKEDFKIAGKNFKKLLEGSRLSVSQIEKLRGQYRSIMDDYKGNRELLEKELPKIVETRLNAVIQCFLTMAEFYCDNDNAKDYISDLIKLFGDIISRNINGVTDKRKCEKLQGKFEICEKCRVNKVEK